MYQNQASVNIGLDKLERSTLTNNFHWSSSEIAEYRAWGIQLNDGYVSTGSKQNNYHFRPVLAF